MRTSEILAGVDPNETNRHTPHPEPKTSNIQLRSPLAHGRDTFGVRCSGLDVPCFRTGMVHGPNVRFKKCRLPMNPGFGARPSWPQQPRGNRSARPWTASHQSKPLRPGWPRSGSGAHSAISNRGILTLTLSPSDGEKEGLCLSNEPSPFGDPLFSFSPSDGERAGVRGYFAYVVTAMPLFR